jgi:hypothetical protein
MCDALTRKDKVLQTINRPGMLVYEGQWILRGTIDISSLTPAMAVRDRCHSPIFNGEERNLMSGVRMHKKGKV